MQVDGERGTPGDDPDMAERRGKVREERDPLVLAAGDRTAGGLGEQSRGEVVQVDGLLRRGHDLPDEGMGADQGEEPLGVISDFPGERVPVGVIECPEQQRTSGRAPPPSAAPPPRSSRRPSQRGRGAAE